MDLAILGLPLSGKTTTFNAITGQDIQTGGYGGDEPHIGVLKVPDPRLAILETIDSPTRVIPAEMKCSDYPGSAFSDTSASGSRGLARFIDQLALSDALVYVVRSFVDEKVPMPADGVDAERDIETLNLELTVADIGLIERRLERIASEMKALKASERTAAERHAALLKKMQEHLEMGEPLRTLQRSDDELRELTGYRFVTDRPLLVLVNINENDVEDTAAIESEYSLKFGTASTEIAAFAATIEEEMAQLAPDEATIFRADLGLPPESSKDRAIRSAYSLLGMHSFLTTGKDEVRAWPIPIGTTASQAAGKIHSDLERGFIRAEVTSFSDYHAAEGSSATLRQNGRTRTEGKDYVVSDGDILSILFNV
ncbi:MAG: redox-regulated ATPase YchF [Chloroflexi bacterium]|jgi:GTP-binding protein YchF|nr:redox-regulated ATPase YchF [Chloroflexota bacterium]|tara:strand:- start:1201 stop:2307 length:1107 start_codon:yes stop_codon:yes gene_type:complete